MTSNEDFRPEQVDQYPLHMVVGVLPPTAGTAAIAGLLAAGIGEESIDLAQGKSAAQRIEDENDDDSLLGRMSKRCKMVRRSFGCRLIAMSKNSSSRMNLPPMVPISSITMAAGQSKH
jgi:hypothetical protein